MIHRKRMILLLATIGVCQLQGAAGDAEETICLGRELFTVGKLLKSKIDSRGCTVKYITSGRELIKVWRDKAGCERLSTATTASVISLNDEDYVVPEVLLEVLSAREGSVPNTSLFSLLSGALVRDAETGELRQVEPIEAVNEDMYAQLRGRDVVDSFFYDRRHDLLRLWEMATNARFAIDSKEYISMCNVGLVAPAKIFAVKSDRTGFGCIRVMDPSK